jgi:hypothetical protein
MEIGRYFDTDNRMTCVTLDIIQILLSYAVAVISIDSEIQQNKLFIITKLFEYDPFFNILRPVVKPACVTFILLKAFSLTFTPVHMILYL